jgi:hypothetical protein
MASQYTRICLIFGKENCNERASLRSCDEEFELIHSQSSSLWDRVYNLLSFVMKTSTDNEVLEVIYIVLVKLGYVRLC